ncbi:MAG TPA: response regulator [Herpetosiphonaceae bacterium]
MTYHATVPQQATVLLVEDNLDNLFVFQDILRTDLGVPICTARASGQQLLTFLTENPACDPDLVLVDLALPYEDGFAVHQALRAHFGRDEAAPKIVALTVDCAPQTVARARHEGFDGFIGKPIERLRFIKQITRILQGDPVWEPV